MKYIKLLSNCGMDDISIVGGKGAALGELMRIHITVPPGFVITTDAYRAFSHKQIPSELRNELMRAFVQLGTDKVAVRSSATMEDSSTASWAGQLESYLNVDESSLEDAVMNCWKSIKSARIEKYQEENRPTNSALAVAVVIQKMIQSEISGVCFTAHPVSGDKNEVVIEACRGLGELLVQGKITPENYVICASDAHVVSHTQANQKVILTIMNGQMHELSISQEKMQGSILSESQRTKIVETAKIIEDHFGKPQDIEWSIEKGSLYIVQSRPITTLS